MFCITFSIVTEAKACFLLAPRIRNNVTSFLHKHLKSSLRYGGILSKWVGRVLMFHMLAYLGKGGCLIFLLQI